MTHPRDMAEQRIQVIKQLSSIATELEQSLKRQRWMEVERGIEVIDESLLKIGFALKASRMHYEFTSPKPRVTARVKRSLVWWITRVAIPITPIAGIVIAVVNAWGKR